MTFVSLYAPIWDEGIKKPDNQDDYVSLCDDCAFSHAYLKGLPGHARRYMASICWTFTLWDFSINTGYIYIRAVRKEAFLGLWDTYIDRIEEYSNMGLSLPMLFVDDDTCTVHIPGPGSIYPKRDQDSPSGHPAPQPT